MLIARGSVTKAEGGRTPFDPSRQMTACNDSARSGQEAGGGSERKPIGCKPVINIQSSFAHVAIDREEDYVDKAELDVERWADTIEETFYVHVNGRTPRGDEFRFGVELNGIEAKQLRDRLDEELDTVE